MVAQLSLLPSASDFLGRSAYAFSVSQSGEIFSALELILCLENSPLACTIWQRPQIPRPPQTESMSTPKFCAACNTEVPIGKYPRFPDGVKTTRASLTFEERGM